MLKVTQRHGNANDSLGRHQEALQEVQTTEIHKSLEWGSLLLFKARGNFRYVPSTLKPLKSDLRYATMRVNCRRLGDVLQTNCSLLMNALRNARTQKLPIDGLKMQIVWLYLHAAAEKVHVVVVCWWSPWALQYERTTLRVRLERQVVLAAYAEQYCAQQN